MGKNEFQARAVWPTALCNKFSSAPLVVKVKVKVQVKNRSTLQISQQFESEAAAAAAAAKRELFDVNALALLID